MAEPASALHVALSFAQRLWPLSWRWVRRYFESRQPLLREGAEVVTPITLALEGLGPAAVSFGTADELDAHLRSTHEKWHGELKAALMTYANAHPSPRVKELSTELSTAFEQAVTNTRMFVSERRTAQGAEWFKAAEGSKDAATATAEQLIVEIRAY